MSVMGYCVMCHMKQADKRQNDSGLSIGLINLNNPEPNYQSEIRHAVSALGMDLDLL